MGGGAMGAAERRLHPVPVLDEVERDEIDYVSILAEHKAGQTLLRRDELDVTGERRLEQVECAVTGDIEEAGRGQVEPGHALAYRGVLARRIAVVPGHPGVADDG
jgi:hypothetical protein